MKTEETKIKAVASFKQSAQISPDDWDSWMNTLEVTENTTIGEIFKWMQSKDSTVRFPHFQISPLYTLDAGK